MSLKRRNALVIVSLVLTFTLPMVLAGWVYWYGPSQGKTTNYGNLITPPMQISTLALTDSAGKSLTNKMMLYKWTLAYVSPTVCDKACQNAIFYQRQIRTATGKEQQRIRPSVLTFSDETPDPALIKLLHNRYPQTAHWVSTALNSKHDFTKGSLYFIDPHGNIMMQYPPGANPSLILKDLNKLLKVSQIG